MIKGVVFNQMNIVNMMYSFISKFFEEHSLLVQKLNYLKFFMHSKYEAVYVYVQNSNF